MRQKMADLADQIKGGHKLPQWLINWGERKLGLHALNVAHAKIEDDWEAGSTDNFFKLACKYLSLNYDLEGLENIPKEGPCVIVSNHPHGMSDGLMFGDIAMKVREDVRIVVNEWLHCVRGMRPYQIKVDVYGGEAAKRANMAGMREILKWLREGHCILVFPSGSAASYSHRDRRVIDDPWQANIAAIIRKTKATVVPMHIAGRTGIFFQIISTIAKGIRANFLAREILRDGRMRHTIKLGKPITAHTIGLLESDESVSDYLRLQSMLLRYPNKHDGPSTSTPKQPVAPNIPTEQLSAEIAALPADTLYYSNNTSGMEVYAVTAQQIPHIMQEMGIERERTFRAAGEGTGTAMDLDDYDEHYIHLIMWDSRAKKLAGAYRIGLTDEIIAKKGIKGVYNAAFFHFDPELVETLKKGLEMGRAFIVPEYQRLATSLDTLWMGIGQFLNRHPRYRYLYGTVSVSQDYTHTSRALILSYLKEHEMHPEYADFVRAFTPPKKYELLSEDARLLPAGMPDIRLLSASVSSIEPDNKSIPVLLRQYLRLGGKMLSFGIDNDFGGTLDCLVLVDLALTPERILKRYCGNKES
ncbi:MAG: lysophospholipid acyltransferase family protein [Akkermansia sp.]|nr:lysophospholipid acyltransferase family protein [Akkermansia sp.]